MNRRRFCKSAGALAALSALPTLAAMPAFAGPSDPEVQVFKSPTCGCCGVGVEHMRAPGFTVKVTEVDDPRRHASARVCPTATAAATRPPWGYVLEGHVRATEVKRLLAAKPKAIGLVVPGMPPSAPGMDVPGCKDPYQMLLVDASGQSSVFAGYPK